MRAFLLSIGILLSSCASIGAQGSIAWVYGAPGEALRHFGTYEAANADLNQVQAACRYEAQRVTASAPLRDGLGTGALAQLGQAAMLQRQAADLFRLCAESRGWYMVQRVEGQPDRGQ